jgi:hypothetical protein
MNLQMYVLLAHSYKIALLSYSLQQKVKQLTDMFLKRHFLQYESKQLLLSQVQFQQKLIQFVRLKNMQFELLLMIVLLQ